MRLPVLARVPPKRAWAVAVAAPAEIVAPFDGLLGAARSITPTRPGDVVAVVAKPVSMEELLAE